MTIMIIARMSVRRNSNIVLLVKVNEGDNGERQHRKRRHCGYHGSARVFDSGARITARQPAE
jgi:hypothetical protein